VSVSTELTARIVAVHQDSPAHKAGVLVGDVVLSVNGQVVRDIIELLEISSFKFLRTKD
jgi:S1-C subfamily serine protease